MGGAREPRINSLPKRKFFRSSKKVDGNGNLEPVLDSVQSMNWTIHASELFCCCEVKCMFNVGRLLFPDWLESGTRSLLAITGPGKQQRTSQAESKKHVNQQRSDKDTNTSKIRVTVTKDSSKQGLICT